MLCTDFVAICHVVRNPLKLGMQTLMPQGRGNKLQHCTQYCPRHASWACGHPWNCTQCCKSRGESVLVWKEIATKGLHPVAAPQHRIQYQDVANSNWSIRVAFHNFVLVWINEMSTCCVWSCSVWSLLWKWIACTVAPCPDTYWLRYTELVLDAVNMRWRVNTKNLAPGYAHPGDYPILCGIFSQFES